MFEAVNPTVPNGTVMEVVQDGFVIGDRVLRPALVGVAKGGPKLTPVAMDDEPQAPLPQAEAEINTPEVESNTSSAGAHVDRSI
jgi:molecular chaperone GrpE